MSRPDMNDIKEKGKDKLIAVGDTAKDALGQAAELADSGKEYLGKKRIQIDKKLLAPVYKDELSSADFNFPFILRIVNWDKRMKKEACAGSIGFTEKFKNENILTLYTDFVETKEANISLYPYTEDTIYCLDPYKTNVYICLDTYFGSLQKAKVNELETIAHSLGAKYVKIALKEEQMQLVTHEKSAKVKIAKQKNSNNANEKDSKGIDPKIGFENNSQNDQFANIKIVSEINFSGNNVPTKPKLTYFKNESDIESLIRMRLNQNYSDIKSKTFSFHCLNKLEMQESTAANIDALLKKIKCTGNASVVSRVQQERRTILEYTIEF